MKDVCIYCASSTSIDKKYIEIADKLAEVLVRNGYGIVYGGGEVGLMGAIADRVLAMNGRITGVIPKFMVEVEWAHKGVKNMVQVETMAERKTRLIQDVSAVIALPGSTGTLDELIDVLSLKKLGKFTKPVIIVNSFGFYDSLLTLFDKMIEERFMRPEHRNLWSVIDEPEDIVMAIDNAPEWDESAIKIAAV